MKSDIASIASLHIAPSEGKSIFFKDGQTTDIIAQILAVDKGSEGDTVNFAKFLEGSSLMETLSNIWHFVKRNIAYKIDPLGYQFVKTPARTWADRYGDCKSYSIFIASILKNLKIPFSYRFVGFTQFDYTHVYIIVPYNNNIVKLDAVTDKFDYEKPFTIKKDYDMTKIYRLSGLDDGLGSLNEIKRRGGNAKRRVKGRFNRGAKGVKKTLNKGLKKSGLSKRLRLGRRNIGLIPPGQMTLLIARDRLEAEKGVVDRIKGIGSLTSERYQDSIDMLTDAIGVIDEHIIGVLSFDEMNVELEHIANKASAGDYSLANVIQGIGDIGSKKKARQAKKAERKESRKSATGNPKASKKAARKEKKQERKASKAAATKGLKGKEKRKAKRAWRAEHGTKTGKFLQKAGKAAKKGLKAVAKVATAPQRLAVKAILEVTLPKAAPFFLYLFINDPALIAKAPAKVQRKRKKSEKVANFIVNVIGMKRDHFMGIVRNGIIKQMGATPENIIAKQVKGKIQGIGSLTVIVGAVGAVVSIIGKLVSLFKAKKDGDLDVSKDDAPDDSDWEDVTGDDTKDSAKDDDSDSDSGSSSRSSSASTSSYKSTSSAGSGGSSSGSSSASYFNDDADADSYAKAVKQQPDNTTVMPDAKDIADDDRESSGGKKVWNTLGSN